MDPNRLKPHSLVLAFFNAYGLSHQRDQIGEFLRDHQVDVLLVQETFLKPCHRSPNIANYHLVRDDRVTSRGRGTAIYYRKSLHCVPIDAPALTNIEVSACRLALSGHPPVTLVSVYLPPDKQLLRSDIEALLDLDNAVILGGDFNCKHVRWNSHTTNINGVRLDALVDILDFDIIAPMRPTHFPHNVAHRPDILDMALLKNVTLRLRSMEVLHELDSDHRPVLMELGSPPSPDPVMRTVVNWQRLSTCLANADTPHLSRIPTHLSSPQDTEAAVSAFTDNLQSAISQSSRQVAAEDVHTQRFKLPDDIKELVRAKNAAIRAHDSYPTRDNRVRMRALQRDVKRAIAELRNNRWDRFLEDLTPSHFAYWRLARSLKSDTVATMPPLSRPSGAPPAFDDDEKAEVLADSLQSQCTLSTAPSEPSHRDRVDREIERRVSLPPSEVLTPVTQTEVEDLIKGLKPKKAPGPDGI